MNCLIITFHKHSVLEARMMIYFDEEQFEHETLIMRSGDSIETSLIHINGETSMWNEID